MALSGSTRLLVGVGVLTFLFAAVQAQGPLAPDDSTAPGDFLDELKKRVACFQWMNCSECRKSHGCAWCSRGRLTVTTGSTRHIVSQGPLCWPGGFFSLDSVRFGLTFAGFEASIQAQCPATRVSTVNCKVSDGAIIGLSVGGALFLILCFIICGVCCRKRHLSYSRIDG